MKKYIVVWVITTFASKSQDLPKNEFGLPADGNRYMIELVEEVNVTHLRDFRNRDSAIAFFERGKKQMRDTLNPYPVTPFVKSIRIDSITLKK